MNYTVQLLEEQHNGYEDWQTYAVRDQHNVCVCVVGAVDHATAATNYDTARLIADALTHETGASTMSDDTTTLRGLLADFRDTLETDRDDILELSDPDDVLHEYADSAVPIYTADLMKLAADDIDLATAEPECGPAFDGSPTPVNIVAGNVYEALLAEGYEWLSEAQDED